MADKAIVDRIKARELARPQALLDAFGSIMAVQQNYSEEAEREAVAAGLEFLVKDFREAAEQYIEAKLRGGKALADDYRAAAAKLQLLVIEMRKQAGRDERREASRVQLPAEWCRQHHVHGPHNWPEEAPTHSCSGYHPTSTDGLQAFVAERAAAGAGSVTTELPVHRVTVPSGPGLQTTKLDPPITGPAVIEVTFGKTSGDSVQQVPVFVDPPALPEFERAFNGPPEGTQAEIELHNDDAWAYAVAGAAVAADRAAAPVPSFVEPTGPGARDVPGKRVSWEDLGGTLDYFRRGPETAMEALGLPEFLSHTQVNTLADCGTKYLLQYGRKALGVVQVPQWAFIGGNGFHAAIERFEQLVTEVKTEAFVRDRLALAGGVEALWKECFAAVVGDTAIANPQMPMDTWRASKKGLEGWSWWLVNGEDMLRKYVDRRIAELAAPWRTVRYTSGGLPLSCPECGCTRDQLSACTDAWHSAESVSLGTATAMIEHEYVFDVEGVPFKGVIDQVWNIVAEHGPMRPGDILIDDAKAGATVPGDTAQLGEYALWLSRFGGGQGRRIWGRFYDARKGTWSEPIDLLARHPWNRFVFEVAAADRQKRAGIFTPRPSSFCGGCSVKHACPIFAPSPAP